MYKACQRVQQIRGLTWAAVEGGSFSMEPGMMNCALEECRKPYLAHVRRNGDGSFAIHHLEEHLRAVAPMAQGGLQDATSIAALDGIEMKSILRSSFIP